MPHVHPTAAVDPRAELAHDVRVGPGCVIDGPVKIGPGTTLIGHVYIQGRVTLGSHNKIYPFVCIGFEPQHRCYDGSPTAVVIGDHNTLRESVTIHRATKTDQPTTLGHDNYLMTNTHVGHDATLADHCTLASGALVGGHTLIEDHVFLGGNAAIHQFCQVGRQSFVGGLSAVTKDVPPYVIVHDVQGVIGVIGVNLVGLRRSNTPRAAIDALKTAFKTLYLSGHTNPVAADLIEQQIPNAGPGAPLLTEMVRFIRANTRGLCAHAVNRTRSKTNQ